MECNKDEAIRAKIIAEKKLSDKDYAGAKKFILKAQNLYPGLDGVSQILTILDVYIASEHKVNGELNWYAILGANANDDDETIRKHYRKLALMLHPDKNKSIGADGAFKLLSEAWSLLSDKAKRLAYNQRSKIAVQPPQPAATKPPVRRPPPPAAPRKTDTFWTICHGCKMHYEYLKLYLNHTLLCPNCRHPFLAKEMPPPSNLPNSKSTQSKSTAPQRHQNTSNHGRHAAATKKPGPPPPGINTDPSIASKAASVIKQVNDRLKREREELFSGCSAKKQEVNDENRFSGVKVSYHHVPTGNGNLYRFSINNSVNRTRELNPLETRHMLMKMARTEIHRKLKESQNSQTENDLEEQEHEQELAMNVPDPDFHDFDLDRTENSFEDNQVWSAYDDDDGMPRFYALIHKVLSRKPLKMKLSWLNSKTTTEFGSFDWLGYGFCKTLGEFRIGRHEINTSLNSFSQKVEWIKSPRGSVIILPKKGQVWALYRNWARDWNESMPDNVIHKYDMVQVLEDYNEEQGVSVSPLVKFSGFRTVFHPHTFQTEVKVIPKDEMFRFSHQVPKYLLTGSEAHNSPKDCLELDPAATPLDLIQES